MYIYICYTMCIYITCPNNSRACLEIWYYFSLILKPLPRREMLQDPFFSTLHRVWSQVPVSRLYLQYVVHISMYVVHISMYVVHISLVESRFLRYRFFVFILAASAMMAFWWNPCGIKPPWYATPVMHQLPPGKLPYKYGKSPSLMGKSTISTGPCSSSQTVYQFTRAYSSLKRLDKSQRVRPPPYRGRGSPQVSSPSFENSSERPLRTKPSLSSKARLLDTTTSWAETKDGTGWNYGGKLVPHPTQWSVNPTTEATKFFQ